MRKVVFLMLLAAFAVFALDFSGDTLLSADLKNRIETVPPHKNHPNASFYIIVDSTITRMLQNGGYEIERYYLAKAYTYRGKKKLSNYKILYNANYEEVELLRARTINADGISSIDSTQLNEITPPSYSDATIYAKMTQMVVSLPAFSESSAVEIHYKIKTKTLPPKPFGNMNVLVTEEPAKKVFYALQFYSGRKPRWLSISDAPQPTISGGQIQWEIDDWDGVQLEPQIPPLREIMPTIMFSASKNWNDEAEKIAADILTKTVADEKVKAVAESLAADKNKRAATENILFYIQEKFDPIFISPNLVGYKPNTAAKVFENGYGDSRDLSVLLIAMLKSVGIDAYPALIASGGARIYDIPTLYQFNRMVVAAQIKGKTLFLDPMREYADVGYLGAANGEKALVIIPGKAHLEQIPLPEPNSNRIDFSYNLHIGDDGSMDGTISTEASGSPAQNIRSSFRHAKKRKKKQRIETAASNVADGAKIEGKPIIENVDKNSGAARLQFDMSAKNFLTMQDKMAIIWLPHTPFSSFDLPNISKEKRKFPLFIDEPEMLSKNFTIYFPDKYKTDYVPPIQSFDNEVGSLMIGSQSGEYSLAVNITLKLKKKRITPDDYENLRQLIRALTAKRYRIILLEEKS